MSPTDSVAEGVGVLTAGVDLATEPGRTAMAALRWEAEGAFLESLDLGVDDHQITRAASLYDKPGIDCPLG